MQTQAIPASSSAAPAQSAGRSDKEKKYPTFKAALEAIMADDPQVVGFGELHPKLFFTYKSTKARFAEEAVAVLAAKNFKVLILESILSDPAVNRDLDHFYQTGCEIDRKNTPALFDYILLPDAPGTIKILKKCREKGIRVYAGGMTIEQAKATTANENYAQREDLIKGAAAYTTASLKRQIAEQLGKDPACRIAVYGGALHNDLDRAFPEYSYGEELRKKIGRKYVEVNLFLSHDIPNDPAAKFYSAKFAATGVKLINNGATRTVLFSK